MISILLEQVLSTIDAIALLTKAAVIVAMKLGILAGLAWLGIIAVALVLFPVVALAYWHQQRKPRPQRGGSR